MLGGDEADLVRLMVAYQAGELDAFEGLYVALRTDLRRYFGSVVREAGVVEDLVQETFMQVHRSRRLYLPPLPVRPWLFGIATNVLRGHRRIAWRRARHEVAETSLSVEQERATRPAGRPPALEPTDIEDALHRLPVGRREVWLLHHVQGFSFRQIAEQLRIGAGAAKLRSSRAMKALRAALGIEPGVRDE